MADAANMWDIVNAVAQSIGAIGTTGALLVAARVYRRQVDDQLRQQASRLLVSITPDGEQTVVTARNVSDLPVYRVICSVTGISGIERTVPVQLDPGDSNSWMYSGNLLKKKRDVFVSIDFIDASGRIWARHWGGSLTLISARHDSYLDRRKQERRLGNIVTLRLRRFVSRSRARRELPEDPD